MKRRSRIVWLSVLVLIAPGCRHSTHRTSDSRAASTTPGVEPAHVRFSDVTNRAGLAFIQSNGGCGRHYLVEQVAAGAAFLDANGDGFLDIYFPQPRPLEHCAFKTLLRHRLYLNDTRGGFKLAPRAFGGVNTDYGIAAAVGDYDNDGHPDLYVACYGRNKLFRNRGNGTFEDVTERAGVSVGGFSTGAVWFDYDGDGFLDLYVLRYCEWSEKTNIPCPGPHGDRAGCVPYTYQAARHVLFHNNGDGTFADVTKKALPALERRRGLGAAAADFDGDGRLDLFVANDLSPNFLLHNLGGSAFEDTAMQQGVAFGLDGEAQANMGIAVGDYNDTGRLSVVVTTFANEPYTVYRNEGGYFSDVSAETGIGRATLRFLGFGAGFLDCRNSGRLDLFFANGHVTHFNADLVGAGYKERNQVFLNDGAGRFVEAPDALPAADVRVHRGACFGDFDNDGRVDILVTASDDRPTLLHNDSDAGNWLQLKLTNKQGCCTPIGARCLATVGGKKLTRVVLGGGSYGGDSDYRVHFGLGKAGKIDRLEIHWLSGQTQVLANVPANRILAIHEPR